MGIDTTVVRCEECGSRNLVYEEMRGERYCEECGVIVQEDIIDPSPEWREFPNAPGESRSRVGAPTTNLIHDKGLATDIDWRNSDYSGAPLKNATKVQMYRMRKWQRRSRTKDARERNLQKALSSIDSLCSKMNLPRTIKERSADIYKKSLESDLVRGRSIDAMVAASVFIANQQIGTARTVDDISKVSRIGSKEIGRTYRDIKRKLSIKTPVPDPRLYLQRFCSELGLNTKTRNEAMKIIDKAEEYEMTHGKSPSGISAAALYIASNLTGQNRTQREIAEVTNVTEVTIRNRYKQLAKTLKIKMEF